MVFTSILEAAKYDVAEAVYEASNAVEAGEATTPFVGVNSPAFRTSRQEVHAFYQRLQDLIQEFRTRGESFGGDDAVMLKLTYALREPPLPSPE